MFTFEQHQHGCCIIGRLPVTDMLVLSDMWQRLGYKLIAPSIAEKLGATIAVVKSDADRLLWEKELGIGPENPNWLLSGDTGTSSKTIFSVMTGMTGRELFDRDIPDIPYDPSDFGRCHRLLKRFPEYRARLPEVAAKYPEWEPFVREWDRMTALYVRDEPTGKNDELYDLMQKLVDEARKVNL